jgi:hypothetical protein
MSDDLLTLAHSNPALASVVMANRRMFMDRLLLDDLFTQRPDTEWSMVVDQRTGAAWRKIRTVEKTPQRVVFHADNLLGHVHVPGHIIPSNMAPFFLDTTLTVQGIPHGHRPQV